MNTNATLKVDEPTRPDQDQNETEMPDQPEAMTRKDNDTPDMPAEETGDQSQTDMPAEETGDASE